MVYYLIAAVHIIVCIILVLVVLLQSGKGADLAGAFGGGATQTAFGSRGPASFLSKMTTAAAIIFMLTSIGLSLMSSRTESKSILDSKHSATQSAPKKPAADATSNKAGKSLDQIQKEVESLNKKQQNQPAATPDTKQQPADNKAGKK
jgi:preprotein translocase subunit SecG